MVDEPRAQTDAAAPGWSHADQIRAVLAGMRRSDGQPGTGATRLMDLPLPVTPPDVAVPTDLFEARGRPCADDVDAAVGAGPTGPDEIVDVPSETEEPPPAPPPPVPIVWTPSPVREPVRHVVAAVARPAPFSGFMPPAPISSPRSWSPGPSIGTYVPPPPLAPMLEHGIAAVTVKHKRHRLRRSMAVLVVLALVAGAGGGVLYWRHRNSGPSSWDPRVRSIVQFVEQARGLQFKHPVAVDYLSSPQFDKVVSVPQPTSARDRAGMNVTMRALRALGLVTGDVNLASSQDALDQADVVGLYMSSTRTVYVRGTAMTPFVRVTLAHELTHALQDQYFGLDQLQASRQNADSLALTALIEGDATRVEHAYEQSLSSADQQAYQQDLQAAGQRSSQTAHVPAVVSDLAGFPYAFGPTYADALFAQGGVASLNAAFRDPPRAQAQILDPDAYPATWHPLAVARPALPAGGRALDTASPFGQAMLFEVLGSRLGYQQAWAAVQGWQGDNSVPYSSKGKTCVAIDVRTGSIPQAATLAVAGSAWAAASGIPGAAVTSTGTLVSFRSCDPGAAGTAPPASSPSAFDVLAARAEFIDGILTSGPADFALARCVVDDVMGQLGPGGYGELTAATLSQTQEQGIEQMAQAAAGTCRAAGVS